ncbi:MAG: transcriptional repressor LexA [Candidatus Paceibacterota bacterium]
MGTKTTTYEKAVIELRTFHRRHKRMPSFAELGKLVGLRSKNAVSKLISKLSESGVVGKDSTGRLIPLDLESELKVLGSVEAGFPSAAEEELLDTLSLDEYLVENKEASFLLEVKGESMIDAGIREGDLVIAERGATPRSGDVVVAEVDGEWTMKYYRTKGSKVWLEPANKKFKPIYPKEELQIAAVIKGVVRKY